MSLSRKIAAALDARPDHGALPCEVTADEGGCHLSLNLTAAGPVGLAFDVLTFSAAGGDRPPEAVRAWADQLAARVTYLMEPLVPVEHDALSGELEMRSRAPTDRDGRRAYYSLRLNRDGTARLSRIVADDATRRRQPAPCHLTREALERLADDLAAAAAG
jgi:hypothetical protein